MKRSIYLICALLLSGCNQKPALTDAQLAEKVFNESLNPNAWKNHIYVFTGLAVRKDIENTDISALANISPCIDKRFIEEMIAQSAMKAIDATEIKAAYIEAAPRVMSHDYLEKLANHAPLTPDLDLKLTQSIAGAVGIAFKKNKSEMEQYQTHAIESLYRSRPECLTKK